MKKSLFALMLAALFLLGALCACTPTGAGSTDKDTSVTIKPLDFATLFSQRDLETGYDSDGATFVSLSANGFSCSSNAVSIKNKVLTISVDGVYVFSGIGNGQIVVDAAKTAKVQIVLNGAHITCETSAAIYVRQAAKTFVTAAQGTSNTLQTTQQFVAVDQNNVDAAVFSKDDLTINGNGALMVNCLQGHGIVSKDDLVCASVNLTVTSQKSALNANNSVRIASGTYNLTAGTDGIHCAHDTDSALGYIFVAGGNFVIESQSDCIEASGQLQFMGGTLNARSSGAGLYARDNLLIAGGVLNITSSCDTIYSKKNVNVQGGEITCSSQDDGIHADGNVAIRGGQITVAESYEGIEGQTVDIMGGTIEVHSSDDGLNAAGGKDQSGFGGFGGRPDQFVAAENCYIKISGGSVKIFASGDGIDSNGNLFVTGGECYVCGPVSNGNSAIDYDGNAQITGGVLVATGSSGMAQNFGEKSTQCSIMVNCTRTNGEVVLSTKGGKEVLRFKPTKWYTSVVISCSSLEVSETYVITTGSQSQTIKLTDVIYGSGNGMFGPGGGPGGRP